MSHRFTEVENKAAIWKTLQTRGYFKGFPANMKENVKRLLDKLTVQVDQTYSDKTYDEKVAQVINLMGQNRDLFLPNFNPIQETRHSNAMEQGQRFHNNQYQSMNGSSSIDELYRAEDLQEQRMAHLNGDLEKKRAEMTAMLDVTRPSEIDFTDRAIKTETKIGSEMERLLAEAQASRQRDLDEAYKKSSQQKNTDNISSNQNSSSIHDDTMLVDKPAVLQIDHSSPNIQLDIQSITTPKKTVRFSDGIASGKTNNPVRFGHQDKPLDTRTNNFNNLTNVISMLEVMMKKIDDTSVKVSQIQDELKLIRMANSNGSSTPVNGDNMIANSFLEDETLDNDDNYEAHSIS